MFARRFPWLVPFTLALVLAGSASRLAGSTPPDVPSRLTDQEFWRLSQDFSEPNGSFQSDNLLSNEMVFARVVPELLARTKPGGVYLGVGPEQNFTYIAAMKPRIVFITDIRRGNLHLQLMYKALFELSADRAEFVSRLFTKKRPDGLSATSTAYALMNAYWDVHTGDEAAYAANLQAIYDLLTKKHALPLDQADLQGIGFVYRAFYWYGPAMTYSASTNLTNAGRGTTYADLMMQTDPGGQGLSYLGSEEKFAFLKDLESKNLIVPVVGNFAGPKALRAVGAYVKEHGATVSAFYVSNVESYLQRNSSWQTFCGNVASMPLDDGSVFIRPSGSVRMVTSVTPPPTPVTAVNRMSLGFVSVSGGNARSGLVPMAAEVRGCSGGG